MALKKKYQTIEELLVYPSLEPTIEVFFEIADMYNQYRANHKGKAPSKYWIINRDEVPEIKSFEEFKKKVTE